MLQNWERARALTRLFACSCSRLRSRNEQTTRKYNDDDELSNKDGQTDRQIRVRRKKNHSDNLRVLLVCTICVDRRPTNDDDERWDENWLEILINHETNFMYTNKNNKHITRSPYSNGSSTQTQKNSPVVKSVATTITLTKRCKPFTHAHKPSVYGCVDRFTENKTSQSSRSWISHSIDLQGPLF